MTAKSSRLLPFIVLGILVGTLITEQVYNIEINLQDYLPLLVAIGIGGAAKSAITKAAQAKAEVDKLKIVETIKEQLEKEKQK